MWLRNQHRLKTYLRLGAPRMLRYLISIPILAIVIVGLSALWFFGVLNRAEPNAFVFHFVRICSGYEQQPNLSISIYDDGTPRFRFMLHAVTDVGNRVISDETCSRLSFAAPEGTHRFYVIGADSAGKLVRTEVTDYSDDQITILSRSGASEVVRCDRPAICLEVDNVVGVEALLPQRPAKISFTGRAAYFSVFEHPPSYSYFRAAWQQRLVDQSQQNLGARSPTTFEIGLQQAYELTSQTTPQPAAYARLYGDGIDSWYRFDPQAWPYVRSKFVSVLFAYQSRLWATIRDSSLFLLAAILGVAVQAALDASYKRAMASRAASNSNRPEPGRTRGSG